jgi:hypothetical protein
LAVKKPSGEMKNAKRSHTTAWRRFAFRREIIIMCGNPLLTGASVASIKFCEGAGVKRGGSKDEKPEPGR